MACTSSGDIEPSTSSRRTSAWAGDTWSSTATVVGDIQPMSRTRVLVPVAHRMGRARVPDMTRPFPS